ncbi:MAG: ABC transporter ATP-binding protein [Tissierellia bacterium]|nr:ABC transporter ATP-binding protein [Tissierellia bacterium]
MYQQLKDTFLKISNLYQGRLMTITMLSFLLSIILPLELYLLSKMIDRLTLLKFPYLLFIIYGLIHILAILLGYFRRKTSLFLELDTAFSFQKELIEKNQVISYEHMESSDDLDHLHLALQAGEEEMVTVVENTLSLLGDFLQIVGILWLFLKAGPVLIVFYIFTLFIIVFFDFKAMDLMNRMFQKQSEKERRFNDLESKIMDRYTLSYLRMIGGLSLFREKLVEITELLSKERIETTVKAQRYAVLSRVITLFWFLSSFFYLALGTMANDISIGLFTSLVASLLVVLQITEEISFQMSNLARNSFYIREYEYWLNLDEEKFTQGKKDKTKPFIEMRGVCFTYPGTDVRIIDHLNVKIENDEKIALVGLNGAGKTTFIKLLLGLYQADQGQIMVFGKDINAYSKKELAKIFSTVLQDFACFERTIRENVALYDYEHRYDDNRIDEALAYASLKNLQDKKDTYLGKTEESGIDLSRGQWQRLAIARGIFPRDTYLILDEPLSNADPLTEAAQYDRLFSLIQKRGLLLISHRMVSAKMADRILLLDKGKIVEDGNHQELMANQGLYCQLFEEQKKWVQEVGKHD